MQLPTALLRRLESEAASARDDERKLALEALAKHQAELTRIAPGLNTAVKAAQDHFDQVKREAEENITQAAGVLADARSEKSRAIYPLERSVELLRSQLAGELRHPAIAAALEIVIETREGLRQFVAEADNKAREREAAWCKTTMEELTALQFAAGTDIEKRVQQIMGGKPA